MLRYTEAQFKKAHAFEFDGRGMILLCWNDIDRVNQLEGLSKPEQTTITTTGNFKLKLRLTRINQALTGNLNSNSVFFLISHGNISERFYQLLADSQLKFLMVDCSIATGSSWIISEFFDLTILELNLPGPTIWYIPVVCEFISEYSAGRGNVIPWWRKTRRVVHWIPTLSFPSKDLAADFLHI